MEKNNLGGNSKEVYNIVVGTYQWLRAPGRAVVRVRSDRGPVRSSHRATIFQKARCAPPTEIIGI